MTLDEIHEVAVESMRVIGRWTFFRQCAEHDLFRLLDRSEYEEVVGMSAWELESAWLGRTA